ncbi:MAG: hypothetical protein ACRD04_01745 [Terriglobales bacterium]
MKHLHEKQLADCALGYGALPWQQHLQDCAPCRERLQDWRQFLAACDALEAPQLDGDRLWRRIEGVRASPPPRCRLAIWIWAPMAACLLLAGTFWMVRPSRSPTPAMPPAAAVLARPSPLLRLAVARHLECSQALLIELAHAPAGTGQPVDLTVEKSSARDLLAANRLYRQSARRSGDAALARVLGALEPALIEIAHSPRQVSTAGWRQLQDRIAASNLLFKVRVVDQNLRTENGAL